MIRRWLGTSGSGVGVNLMLQSWRGEGERGSRDGNCGLFFVKSQGEEK